MSEPTIDTSTKALAPCPFCNEPAEIERSGDGRQSTIYACTMCGCRLETGEEWNHGAGWNERPMEAALAAERDAAVARASEHGAYRTAASAFLASKNLLPEFDAWCEARGMPADAVGALVEVARAARHGPYAVMSDGRLAIEHVRDALDKLAAIAPGILDHSEG